MSEHRTGRKIFKPSLIATGSAGIVLLAGCLGRQGGEEEVSFQAPTPQQLTDAYTSCEVDFDSTGFSVIESGEPTGKVQYTVHAKKNPSIAGSSGISYKGLVAEISGDELAQGARGAIYWKDEAAGLAIHELPSIDVYGPNSVAYNLFATAEADLGPAEGAESGLQQSYRYCGTVAVWGHTNLGLTDVQPVEPFLPTDGIPTVELRPVA